MRLFKYIFKLGQCDSTKSLSPSSMYKLQILNAFEIGSFSSSRYALAIHFIASSIPGFLIFPALLLFSKFAAT